MMDDANPKNGTAEVKTMKESKKSSLRSRDKGRKGKKGGASKKKHVPRQERKKKVKSPWEDVLEDVKWNLLCFFREFCLYICIGIFAAALLLALYLAEDILDIHKIPKITSTVTCCSKYHF